MRWELWEPRLVPENDPSNDYFFSADEVQLRRFAAEDDMHCTWTVQADDYETAMQLLYDHRGWGRYTLVTE
jgi:hypothetical protein